MRPGSMASRARLRGVSSWAFVAMVALLLAWDSDVRAGSASTVVTATVPSAVSLSNNCEAGPARDFGTVQPGTAALTNTGASVCSFTFQSSNASAMLRAAQADGGGTAMGLASGSWTWSATTPITRLYGATYYDSSTVFAVGSGGHVRRSIDGGASWTAGARWSSVTGAGGSSLNDIQPVPGNSSTWYAAGSSRSVVKVTNAMTGTPTFASASGDLAAKGWGASDVIHALHVVDALNVIIVGDSGRVGFTIDGGTTWTVYQVGTASWRDIARVDATTYWMSSTQKVAYSTGGYAATGNWTPVAVPTFGSLYAITAPDASHVYAAGIFGDVVGCTVAPCSNPANWTARSNPDLQTEPIRGIASPASAPNTVLVAGGLGTVLKSTTGGASWSTHSTGSASSLYALAMDPLGTQAVAVGGDAATVRTPDLSSWSLVGADSTSLAGVDVNPGSGRKVIAVGSAGAIRRSTDGGATWTAAPPDPEADSLFGIDHASSDVAWAVGDRGSILRTDDGGATWSAQSAPAPVRLWSVSAVDESTAYIAGAAGTLLKTTNGGTSWINIAPATTATIHAVSARPSGRVVIVGYDNLLRTSSNGGSTWTPPSFVPSAQMLDVSMGDDLVGYAVSAFSAYKTVDGGTNWSYSGSAAGGAVHTAGPDVAWTAGAIGSVRKTLNGGATWTATSTGAGAYGYRDIAAIDGSTAIAVGDEHVVGLTGPTVVPGASIPDYGAGPSNWAGASSPLFGMCLQAVSAQTVVNTAEITRDTTPPCTAADSDPWRGIPTTLTKLASTTNPGDLGRIDLVWGFRPALAQTPGVYTAAVSIEALAPNVP